MNRTTISGYQSPVDILSPEDVVIAQAACRYRAETDATGASHWSGRLHRIAPADAIGPAPTGYASIPAARARSGLLPSILAVGPSPSRVSVTGRPNRATSLWDDGHVAALIQAFR
jgi:hypothetical protein